MKQALTRFFVIVLAFTFWWCAQDTRQPAQAATLLLRSLPVLAAPSGGGCTSGTNELGVRLLTYFGNTSNNNFYVSAAVTPSSNALLYAFVAYSPIGTTLVTNTGSTQLTWWKAKGTNYNTLASPANGLDVWVTQLARGVAPFSMSVVFTNSAGGTGCAMHVYEVTGADDTAAWGTNAIVQVFQTGSNATANARLDFSAPGNNGLNAIVYGIGDDINSTNDMGTTNLWAEGMAGYDVGGNIYYGGETAYNTPATGLFTGYRHWVSNTVTFVTNNNTSRDWAGIGMEIKAGTNCSDQFFPGLTYYVDTASTGGDGTTTNLSGANAAFQYMSNAIAPLSGTLTLPVRIYARASTGLPDLRPMNGSPPWDFNTTWANYLELIAVGTPTGVFDTNKWWIRLTNNSAFYNNMPQHMRWRGLQAQIWVSSSGVNNWLCFRQATANIVGTDLDLRSYGCIAEGHRLGGTDNIEGFVDSPPTGTGTIRRMNDLAYGLTSGFVANWDEVENYNCTAVTNGSNFLDQQRVVNCLADTHTGSGDFNAVSDVSGSAKNNASSDATAPGTGSRTSQTFTFNNRSGNDFKITTGDAGAKNFGTSFPLPYFWLSTAVEGNYRGTTWSMGYSEPD